MEKKMYAINPIIKLPQNLLLSDVMHNVKTHFALPENIKETYYENASPNSCHEKSIKSEAASDLIVRQEKILETLKKIKEKLIHLQQDHRPNEAFVTSTKAVSKTSVSDNEFESLVREKNMEIRSFAQKIENIKNLAINSSYGVQEENNEEEILDHLIMLKDELQSSSKRNIIVENEKFQELSEKHDFVLEIILSLQNLLASDIPLLQEDTKKPSGICLHEHHTDVLQLISRLRNEFGQILDAINAEREIEEEDDIGFQNYHVHPLESGEYDFDDSSPDFGQKFLKSGVIQDVVVCSDSAHPPYFLLALKNLLGPRLKVCLSSTVHSSSSQVDQNTLNLFQDKNLRDRSDFDVAFTVIWKNQKFKSLMVNPLTQCAIIGEGNILRYLSRLSPSSSPLNYESGDLAKVTEVDYWLDLIQMKLLHGNNKEQQNALKQLNSKLGSSDWLNGKQFGVCDIFLWSVLKQLDQQLSSAAPSNVGSWMKKISKIAEFDIEGESYSNPKGTKFQEQKIIKKHFSRGDLEKFFNDNGIKFQSRNHKEVFTVDTLMDEVGDMSGLHMKNLFLKDKKKNLYLLCARHDSKTNLNDVAKKIGAKELRFADENTLKNVLGVTQGCVTLYALVNDPENRVHILLDSEATKNDVYEFVNFHPLVNSATLGISPKDLGKFLELVGHKTTVLDI